MLVRFALPQEDLARRHVEHGEGGKDFLAHGFGHRGELGQAAFEQVEVIQGCGAFRKCPSRIAAGTER